MTGTDAVDIPGAALTAERASGLAAEIDRRLRDGLGEAAAMFERAPGVRAATVTEWNVLAACPTRAAAAWQADDDTEYRESARNARRRVALTALQRWSGDGRRSPLPTVIDAVVGSGDGLAPGLAEWLGALDDGGRAAVADAALTWAVPLVPIVAARPNIRIAEPSAGFDVNCPTLALRLRGRADATVGRPGGPWQLLSADHRDPMPERERRQVAWLALCAAAGTRRPPSNVTVLEATTGRRARFAVDDALIDLALDHLGAFAAALGEVTRGRRSASHTTGTAGCRTCPVLEGCDTGLAESTRPRVVGGISLSE